MDFINNRALIALNEGQFDLAQKLLKKNIKNNPSHLSYNNLGYFYCDMGMTRKNGQIIRANKIGMRYLLKAREMGESYKNYMALGIMSKYNSDFNGMHEAFKNAVEIKNDYAARYNLGATYVLQGKIELACQNFKNAFDNSVINENRYASCLAYIHAKSMLKESVDDILFDEFTYKGDEKRGEDEISALYLQKRYKSVCVSKKKDLLAEYPDMIINSMVIDSFLNCKDFDGANNFIQMAKDYFEDDDIIMLYRILENDKLRLEIINDYQFGFGLEDRVCCYIECHKHDI